MLQPPMMLTTASCKGVVKIEGQSDQDPACSPDGRFMCVLDNSYGDGISVRLHDLCSAGKVVLARAVCFPVAAQQADSLRTGGQRPHGRRHMAVWWSSCGFKVLMRVPYEGCSTNILDYLVALHF